LNALKRQCAAQEDDRTAAEEELSALQLLPEQELKDLLSETSPDDPVCPQVIILLYFQLFFDI